MPATERVERIQSGEDRRRGILSVLRRSGSPGVGSDLARRLDVSRQVIVQDIALLRARGHKILATPRGYLMLDAGPRASTQGACRHTRFEEMEGGAPPPPRRGYLMLAAGPRASTQVACRHTSFEEMEDELSTIVGLGGTAIDVVVEHPLYGEIRGLLMLKTQEDVLSFVARMRGSGAAPRSRSPG